jgi:hypothetical protein
VSDLGFAALQTAYATTYAGEPYHSLSLLDEATKNEPRARPVNNMIGRGLAERGGLEMRSLPSRPIPALSKE